VVARFDVNVGGIFSLKDYFEPFDYQHLDAADLDLGTTGFSLLDPTVFVRPGVTRMGVTAGKNSKIYVLNALNLGGLDQGPGGQDAALQEIRIAGPVWGGLGSYPREGGYI
jgi:iron transport multicopper oxidase